MPTVKFKKDFASFEVNSTESLMQQLVAQGRPVASSCGGDGICAKCRVEIVSGMENLNAPEPFEVELAKRLKFNPNERLSCQALVLNDEVTLDTSYW